MNNAKNCEFGGQQESNLRARIVYGVKCPALQERLMRNPDLSLKEVINYCRSEDAKNKSKEINGNSGQRTEIQLLNSKFKSKFQKNVHQGSNFRKQPNEQQQYHCKKCTFPSHSPNPDADSLLQRNLDIEIRHFKDSNGIQLKTTEPVLP